MNSALRQERSLVMWFYHEQMTTMNTTNKHCHLTWVLGSSLRKCFMNSSELVLSLNLKKSWKSTRSGYSILPESVFLQLNSPSQILKERDTFQKIWLLLVMFKCPPISKGSIAKRIWFFASTLKASATTSGVSAKKIVQSYLNTNTQNYYISRREVNRLLWKQLMFNAAICQCPLNTCQEQKCNTQTCDWCIHFRWNYPGKG